jgi:putative SOS response-associated peptidase YedK
MCARYTLTRPGAAVAEAFGVDLTAWAPRYNVAPTQSVFVVRAGAAGREGGRAC